MIFTKNYHLLRFVVFLVSYKFFNEVCSYNLVLLRRCYLTNIWVVKKLQQTVVVGTNFIPHLLRYQYNHTRELLVIFCEYHRIE
jgi:hypothetical protein